VFLFPRDSRGDGVTFRVKVPGREFFSKCDTLLGLLFLAVVRIGRVLQDTLEVLAGMPSPVTVTANVFFRWIGRHWSFVIVLLME